MHCATRIRSTICASRSSCTAGTPRTAMSWPVSVISISSSSLGCAAGAAMRGHGPGQETLQVGKRDVTIAELEPVGHYAVRPKFSDGHDTGIYSWDYLYDLGQRQEELWQRYLARLAAAGASRDPDLNAPAPAPAHACGHHHDR